MGWWEDTKRGLREGERKQRAEVEAKARADGKEPPPDMPWGKALLIVAAVLVVGGFLAMAAVGAVIDVVDGSDEPDQQEGQRAEPESQPSGGREGRAVDGVLVIEVIDGDTVELEGIGRSRLIGVDTPEEDECYETAATRYMKRTVEGQRVVVTYQRERRDRFDRALVDIFKNERLVALELARLGYAEELTIAPNDRYAPRIRQAVARAESRQRGRWSTCDEGRERARDDDRRRRERDRERDRARSSPTPAPEPDPEPESEPEPEAPSVSAGTCAEVGINNFPVPPGDPRDRDGDGIACED